MKNWSSYRQLRWSEWLEAMRKDVECTFGILKGRWRVLKTGIRLYGIEAADNIWKTCCALHNWLLRYDGLDRQWEHGVGVNSMWQRELGDNEVTEVLRLGPSQLDNEDRETLRDFGTRCPTENANRRTDFHEIAAPKGDAVSEGDKPTIIQANNEPIAVKDLSCESFQGRLIENFDVHFTDLRDIVWPTRNVKKPTPRVLAEM